MKNRKQLKLNFKNATANLNRKQAWLFYHDGHEFQLNLNPKKEEAKKPPFNVEFEENLDNNFDV